MDFRGTWSKGTEWLVALIREIFVGDLALLGGRRRQKEYKSSSVVDDESDVPLAKAASSKKREREGQFPFKQHSSHLTYYIAFRCLQYLYYRFIINVDI
jgi:hypothetical protein